MWVAFYIVAIVLVNVSFVVLQPWQTVIGDLYLANIIVGFVFVLRDYAQREVGHKVLIATLSAGVLTYFMVKWTADPAVAATITFASITAFAVSELTDWAIYSFWKRPLQQRILISSLCSVPLDTIVFQQLAGYFSPAAFTTEVFSKAIGVAIVWYLLRLRIGSETVPAGH